MKFRDVDIEHLSMESIDDFSKLIIKYLCGKEDLPKKLNENSEAYMEKVLDDINSNFLNYEQFNEVLLLLHQDRISKDFFKFLFSDGKVTGETLKKGIIEFRGLSILNFGNFRFTYERFSKMKKKGIERYLSIYRTDPRCLEDKYKGRPSPIIDLKKVNKNCTWHLGYISKILHETEKDTLEEILKKSENPKEFDEFKEILQVLGKEIDKNQELGEYNTNIYLIWDYIDVYIATSMRKNCEYEETYEIIEKVFKDSRIEKLNLRFFDPTQSYCELNRDKGLIEGLMLKRANCTIYMIQESDTFGKDSELASTLAQKKPVIAFIPDYEKKYLNMKIKEYPLEYIKERIYIFKAENIFEDVEILGELKTDSFEINKFINDYLEEYELYRHKQPFSLWITKENLFKDNSSYFADVCDILARFTKKYWNQRAATLKEYHPLGMQIDLNSGVANGVLVVRDINTCVKILKGILTNSLEFNIKHVDEGYTGLFETNSGCLYRLVTDNKLLTNSFWNFFFKI